MADIHNEFQKVLGQLGVDDIESHRLADVLQQMTQDMKALPQACTNGKALAKEVNKWLTPQRDLSRVTR